MPTPIRRDACAARTDIILPASLVRTPVGVENNILYRGNIRFLPERQHIRFPKTDPLYASHLPIAYRTETKTTTYAFARILCVRFQKYAYSARIRVHGTILFKRAMCGDVRSIRQV